MTSKKATGKTQSDAKAAVEDLDFEAALAELDTVVARMEAGDLSLEASLAAYERGILLTRHCQQALQAAELKVKQLDEDGTLSDFVTTDDEARDD